MSCVQAGTQHRHKFRCDVGKHIEDYWNVDGQRELSDAWTGFTRFIVLNERPPDGCAWSGEEINKKTDDLKTGHCMARFVETHV